MMPTILLFLSLLVLVNGWTDAPNAITAPVASGVMTFTEAALLASLCSLLGVLWSSSHHAVARTVFRLTDLGADGAPALLAALAASVLWGVLAWRFGLPTSESHALLSGLTGAALALGRGRIDLRLLAMVAAGLILSIAMSLLLSRMAVRCLEPEHETMYRSGLKLGMMLTAFLHGAQDGQKFLALLAMAFRLEGVVPAFFLMKNAPLWCGLLMGIGTLLGGRRIVKTLGQELVTLTPQSGFAADLGGSLTLLLCTLGGLPVSTTHVKGAALLGAGEEPDGRVAGTLVLAWLLTFPVCGLLAFCLTRLLI